MARYWAYRLSALNPWIIGQMPPPYVVSDGSHSITFEPPYFNWQDTPPASPDIVILAIKWRRMGEAVQWVSRYAPQSLVISLMNGMGQEEAFDGLHTVRLAVGTTTAAVTRNDSQGRTVGVSSHGVTTLPTVDDPREAALEILNRQQGWGWQWVTEADMLELRWLKLLQNSVINPLTALANCSNGELLHHPLFRLATPLLQEGQTVAAARGVAVPRDMRCRVQALAETTQTNISSMLQDIRAGLETEMGAINGYIVREAAKHHVHVPTHQALARLIESLSSVP